MASLHLARTTVLVCALASASAFAPVASRVRLATTPSRTALVMVAKTAEDKALLASSKKVDLPRLAATLRCRHRLSQYRYHGHRPHRLRQVVMIAKRFGVAQGKGAQAWVEQAVKVRDAARTLG